MNGQVPNRGHALTHQIQDDFIDWRLRLEYDITPDNLVYALVASGHKSGTFNDNLGTNGFLPTTDTENVILYEVGTKNEFWVGNVKARLNGSFFYQDFKDKQVTVQVVTDGTTGTQVKNISGSEVKGAEVDLTWQATENLRAQVGYTFLNSEYTDYTIVTQSPADIARINAGNPSQQCQDLQIIPRRHFIPRDTHGCNDAVVTGLGQAIPCVLLDETIVRFFGCPMRYVSVETKVRVAIEGLWIVLRPSRNLGLVDEHFIVFDP